MKNEFLTLLIGFESDLNLVTNSIETMKLYSFLITFDLLMSVMMLYEFLISEQFIGSIFLSSTQKY